MPLETPVAPLSATDVEGALVIGELCVEDGTVRVPRPIGDLLSPGGGVSGRGYADGRGCHHNKHRNPQKEPSRCPTHLPSACPYHPTTQCSLSNYNDVAARPPAGQQDQLNISNCQLQLLRSTVVLQDFPLTFSELVAPVNLVSVSCRAAGSVRTAHQFRGQASLALPYTPFKCCLGDKVRAQQRISVWISL